MKVNVKSLLPHLGFFVGFIVISLLYFSPVLSGKKLYQSDIVWYQGMAKEQQDFRAQTGEEPFWTDSAFGGMPTYQLGAKYPHNYIKKLDLAIRILPRPADYMLLYFISFYVLLLCLRLDWRYAGLGALAFGFSTYLIVILGVGHNAKAHAIAYMPLVLSGIILTFRKKYILGFVLTSVALGLEIVANHFQMTYYLMLLVLVLGIAYLVDAYRKEILPHFFKSVAILVGAVVLAVGLNATSILATKEYTEFSTRGKSEITINPDGTPKEAVSGLDKAYINQYSYGKLETLNLFVARLFGGSNDEPYDKNSAFAKYLRSQQVPPSQMEGVFKQFGLYYWGAQPGVSGPAYLGAVVVFLFVLGLFLVKGRLKWWLVGGTVLTILLSYGSNLSWFTDLWVDYFPLYNKFRAVTSIQVITELCVPVLGIFGLWKFMQHFGTKENKLKALKLTTLITAGVAAVLLLGRGAFDFAGYNDATVIDQLGMNIMRAIREDRKAIFTTDVIKTLVLVLLSAGTLWMYLKEKLSEGLVLLILGVLIVSDLVHIDRAYVNTENFVAAREMERPFQATPADEAIAKDTSRYRVYEETVGIGTSRSSYFHKSIGGYHGAKPKRMEDVAEFHLYKGNLNPLHILNVKYIISEDKEGPIVQRNPYANGNAWFVEQAEIVPDENTELLRLDSLNSTRVALVHQKFADKLPAKIFEADSLDTITLIQESPKYLKYKSQTDSDQLAIFSEVYYPDGWNAYIDGNPADHFRANYLLRAMMVPSGNHTIEFKFEPQVVATGSKITLASSILLLLIALGGGFLAVKNKKLLQPTA